MLLLTILLCFIINFAVALESFDETLNLVPKQFPGNHVENNHETGDDSTKLLSRNKRFLIFPAQTLVQFSLCLVSPADIKRNIFVNQGFQLNWLTPNRTSQLPSTFFVVPPIINARSRDKREDISVEENPMFDEMMKMFNDITTEQVYFLIEGLLNYYGHNGTGCLLHSICQMATVPLHQDGDVFHEILQFILTPSDHSNLNADNGSKDNNLGSKLIDGYAAVRNPTSIEEYHMAETLGRTYRGDYNTNHCDEYYTCPNSPLDKITHVAFDE